MISNNLEFDIFNKIATITFSHPKSNSFTSRMLEELSNLISEISNNENVNVVIIKSSGEKVFCAGASFDELLQIDNLDDSNLFFSGFAKLILAMKNCKTPIITRVQGNAVGGGVGIIAASDYVFALQNSSVKLSELSLGFGPFVIEPAVTRKIGKIATQNLTYQPSDWKNSLWAFDNQLFQEVSENIEDLDFRVEKFATNLSNFNRNALIELKKIFWENTNHWEQLLFERAKISGKLALSKSTKEKLIAFKK